MDTASKRMPEMRAFGSTFLALGKKRLALVLALVVLGSFFESVGILMLVPLLGLIFGSANPAGSGHWEALVRLLPDLASKAELLAGILGLYAILLLSRAAVAWQRDLQSLRLALDMVDAEREKLIHAIAGASWRQVQGMQHAHIEFAMNAEVERLSIGTDRLLRGVIAILQLAFLLAVALWLSPALTVIATVAALAGIPILVPVVRAAHAHGRELSRYGAERQAVLSDFLAGMKLAKSYRAEARYARDFLSVCRNIRDLALTFSSSQLISHNAFQLVAGLAAAAIMFVGLVWLGTEPGVLFAMLALMTRLIGPVQQLAQAAQDVLVMLPAFGSISRMQIELAAPPPLAADARGVRGVRPDESGPLEVQVDSIGYRLPDGRKLLRDVSLSIGAGEIAVLLGPSGSGKTTLADLVLGLASPEEGVVTVGGIAPDRTEGAGRARRLVGYVPQDPFLFDTSLRENLLWACPDASEADLWRALAMAEAESFVRALPQGLDTPMGNRGARLSGGERQRVCLARALVSQPGLLVLDEPSSALDPEVEERLLETVCHLRGETTVLLIAHRLPDSFQADCIYSLAAGNLRAIASKSC